MIELAMEFFLGNLCIEIGLWSIKEKQFKKADALFDTGAHTTHIDTGTLKRLGYNLNEAEKSYISTVGSSKLQINNIVMDNIKIGSLELGAALVNFSELSNVSASVILGMNIIKEFNVVLDFENEIITLKPNFDIKLTTPPERFNKHDSRFGVWTINKKHEGKLLNENEDYNI